MPEKTILILGGSFAGVSAAHYILRHVLPSLPSQGKDYQVVLVTPSRHLFFKVAAPRAIVRPDLIPPEALMPDIEEGFAEYSPGQFKLIQAYARKLDINSQVVHIETVGTTSTESSTLNYDALVLATGTASSPLWRPREPKEATIDAMATTKKAIEGAQHIVIVVGGAVGVEVAGELGSEFGSKKKITVYSGNSRLLPVVRPAMGKDAESYLTSLGVKVIHGVRLKNSSEKDGKTILDWDNGKTESADLVLNATGDKPNSEYIPKQLLNERGFVKTDNHLRVEGAGPRVYCLGSLASYSHGGILDIIDAVAPLGEVMEYDLSDGKSGKAVVFKRNEKEMMIVPVGRSKAVGVIFGYRIPSFLAWLIKGRDFMYSNAKPYAQGQNFQKKKKF